MNKNAGGKNTNFFGKLFEEKTNNEPILLNNGYIKYNLINKPTKQHHYYLSKNLENKIITFTLQNGFKLYMKKKYNINEINLFRHPDEVYIIEDKVKNKIIIKILEKKSQNVEGSVETKLLSSISLKREYELALGNQFEIHYGLCLNNFLKKKMISSEKKYIIWNIIFNENNIKLLFGDDSNYFETLNDWFNNI
jgi:hypothetical protein